MLEAEKREFKSLVDEEKVEVEFAEAKESVSYSSELPAAVGTMNAMLVILYCELV